MKLDRRERLLVLLIVLSAAGIVLGIVDYIKYRRVEERLKRNPLIEMPEDR